MSATTTTKHASTTMMEDLLQKTRQRQLDGSLSSDDNGIYEVCDTYRQIWSWNKSSDSSGGEEETTKNNNKRCRECAGERLALLILQMSSGDTNRRKEADEILKQLDYTCRLSTEIFDHSSDPSSSKLSSSSSSSVAVPATVHDDFFSPAELVHLQRVFSDPKGSYWMDHNYQVEPPSPYFSYLVPLPPLENGKQTTEFVSTYGGLANIILSLRRQLAESKPIVASSATYCELWAHNRPVCTGHQLHYDSDNEGMGGAIRHPLLTAIICLTDHGGPTLITNQRLAVNRAADRGWLVHPKTNRVALMDGRVLHCVVPGKQEQGRRVTVMIAFWKRIRVRHDVPGFGAARPFPMNDDLSPTWSLELRVPLPTRDDSNGTSTTAREVKPIPLSHVYENIDTGEPWSRQMGMPDYDQIFQGI